MANTIEVSTYSPYLNTFKTDTQNQFTITYLSDQAPSEGTGSFQGWVKSGACGGLSGALVSYPGITKTTSGGGNYSLMDVPAPAAQNVTVTANGYQPTTRAVEIFPELSASMNFLLGIGGTLSGRVTDQAGLGIPRAMVSTSRGGVLTDSAGRYSLVYLPAGNYDVAVSAQDHISGGARISIATGASTTANFVLTPGSNPPPPCLLNVTDPSVTICTPKDGVTVASPVRFVAGTTSLYPVTGMHVYVDDIARFTTDLGTLDTMIPLAEGTRRVTVQAWDSTGAVFRQNILLPVTSSTVSLLPTSANFGSRLVGSTSPSSFFTLANHTEADLQVEEISASGDFAVSGNTCGLVLAPAANCRIEITFTPTTSGSRTGNLLVRSSDPATPHAATLAGTGTVAAPPPPPPPPPPPSSCTPSSVQPSVTICIPKNGETVSSPVRVKAVTNSATPVNLVQIYVDGIKATEVNASSIDKTLVLAAGARRVTVQAKNSSGTLFKQTINITVR